MTRSPKIASDNHVVRYANKQRCVLNDAGVPVWVTPAAFELKVDTKDGPEEWLSTTWLEFLGGEMSQPDQCRAALVAMRAGRLDPRPSGALAILNVGGSIARAKELGRTLRALHEPHLGEGNSAYATIRGYRAGCPEAFLSEVFVKRGCVSTVHVRSLQD
jgi:hypothetical protein